MEDVRIFDEWHESEFSLAGQPLTLSLKALLFLESRSFLRTLAETGGRARAGEGPFLDLISPDFVRDAFDKFVRVPGSARTKGGRELKTGADVYEVATPGLVVAVLGRLERLASLGEAEGKGSSSPSTSTSASGAGSGASPAASTEPGDGPGP